MKRQKFPVKRGNRYYLVPLHKILFLVLLFSISPSSEISAHSSNIFTARVDLVEIIEDRDFGSSEIYLKLVNTTGTFFTSIITNVNDGDFLTFSIVIFSGTDSSYNVEVDVWESDTSCASYYQD